MQFQLTKEFIDQLRKAIAVADQKVLLEMIVDLHAADIAEIFDEISFEEAKYLYQLLDKEKAADVLVELEDEVRENFLETLTSKEIAEMFVDNMDSDDAADVISELSEEKQEEVISHIEDVEHASGIVDLLNYEEGTAGSLMGKELISVNQNWTVLKCTKEMRRQAEEVDYVYAVYVVDDKNKLLGRLSLKKLLITPSKTKIADIYNSYLISVKANTDSEEVARIMNKYDLVALPVTDELGRLCGRITIDDVVDVMQEEAEKDYQMASGISENVESTDKIWILSRSRLPWLLIGLLGGILGARVIGMHEEEIKIYPEMAFFIPLVAAMGGNVGVQCSAIIVQGLANNTLARGSIFSKLLKEVMVAVINGLICASLIFCYNFFFSDSLALSMTVSIALFSVIIFASIFGTLIPLLLDKRDIDPALATGPFVTTLNDILGITLYFIIGRMMYV